MASRIIIDPKQLTREQVLRPPSDQLAAVAVKTYEIACDLGRSVKRARSIEKWPRFRDFLAACLEGTSRKAIAIKRIGPGYLSEGSSLLRDLTEVAVDFFWVISHYDHRKDDGEKLANQFFLSRNRHFVKQEAPALEALRDDVFLREFISDAEWAKNVASARAEMRGVRLGDNWRVADGITEPTQCHWDSRCKRAAAQAEKMANLKQAPYYQNLKALSSHTHWDSAQLERFDPPFQQALFDRHLNNAIGLTHDVITGACILSGLSVPTDCVLLRQQFVWMST